MLFRKYPVKDIVYGRPWLYCETTQNPDGDCKVNFKALSFYDLLVKKPGMHGDENYFSLDFGGEYPGVSDYVWLSDIFDMGKTEYLNDIQLLQLKKAMKKTGLNLYIAGRHIKKGLIPKLNYKVFISDKKVSQKALT